MNKNEFTLYSNAMEYLFNWSRLDPAGKGAKKIRITLKSAEESVPAHSEAEVGQSTEEAARTVG